jgi:hypothetical protein
MQALYSFISPVPDFDGDIPILAVPISAQPPSDELVTNPSARASASASKTQSSKWKAAANPTPQKKGKKATGRSSSGIKINEPTPKAPALTPPMGPRQKILIHRSKRYTHHEYVDTFGDSLPTGLEPPKPKACTRLPWCQWCSTFSNPWHLGPKPYGYFLRPGASQVPRSISSEPPVLWTCGCQWVSTW